MTNQPTEREIKALQIAAKSKIVRKGNAWIVPSQVGHGEYEGHSRSVRAALHLSRL